MIRSIESFGRQHDFKLVMEHPLFPEIYSVDSVNLIVGKNGSGKTEAIKSIINALLDKKTIDFYVDGETENLGIVYYTPVPFHRPIKPAKFSGVQFVDASENNQKRRSFADVLDEFVAASEMINSKHEIKSRRNFNFKKAAEKIADIIIELQPEDSANILDYAGYINRHKDEFRSIVRERERLEQRIYNVRREARLSKESNELIRLEDQLRDVLYHLRKVRKAFSISILENSRRWRGGADNVIVWVAICLFLGKPSKKSREVVDIFFALQKDNYRPEHESPVLREFFETCQRIDDALNSDWKGCVDLRRNDDGVDIDVSLSWAIERGVSKCLIDTASRLGIVEISFHGMSSGQAAIYHQLINIVQAVRYLEASGKKNILVFIDEGDMLLHLDWQRKYLDLIDYRLGKLRSSLKLFSLQLIVATHSPLLASDALKDAVVNFDSYEEMPALGAGLQKIVNSTFGTPALGYIAERTILALEKKKGFSEIDIKLISQIDDEFIRHYLISKSAA